MKNSILSLIALIGLSVLGSSNSHASSSDVTYTSAQQAVPVLEDLVNRLKFTTFSNCRVANDIANKAVTVFDQAGHGTHVTADSSIGSQNLTLRMTDKQPVLSIVVEGPISGFRKVDPALPSKLMVFVETKKRSNELKSIRFRLESKYKVDIGTIARPETKIQGIVDYDVTCLASE